MDKIEFTIRTYDQSLDEQLKECFEKQNDSEISVDISESTKTQGLIEKELMFTAFISIGGGIAINLLSSAIWDFFHKNAAKIKMAKMIIHSEKCEKIVMIEDRKIIVNKESIEEIVINYSDVDKQK